MIASLFGASTPVLAEPPAECKMEMVGEEVGVLLQRADVAANKNDYQHAEDLLKLGAAELQDYYLKPPTPVILDDTGMHLILAEDADRRREVRLAVAIRRRVLVDRLQLFNQFHHQSC